MLQLKLTKGVLILDIFQFAKQSVIDTYTAFINNWKNAKQAIRIASQTKPSFAKYLEVIYKISYMSA